MDAYDAMEKLLCFKCNNPVMAEALKEGARALEKEWPSDIDITEDGGYCPGCHLFISDEVPLLERQYCPKCGQRLCWGEEEYDLV